MLKRFYTLIIIYFLIFSNISVAGDLLEDDFFEGFTGRIELCSLGIASNSNIIPFPDNEYEERNNNNENISELSKSERYLFAGTSSLPFNIEYALESGTIVYLGTPFYDDAREGVTFGIEKEFESFIGDFSVFGNGADIWEDPYLTNEDRVVTTEFNSGLVLNISEINGTGLGFSLKTKYKYIDDDIIGESYSDLQREGFVHSVIIKYNQIFDVKEKKSPNDLTYKISFNHADINGASNSYNSIALGLKGTYWYKEISIGLSTDYENRTYKKEHSIFNIINKERVITNGVIVTFNNLGKSKNWYIRSGFSVVNILSNISFYDSDSFMVLFSLGYNF